MSVPAISTRPYSSAAAAAADFSDIEQRKGDIHEQFSKVYSWPAMFATMPTPDGRVDTVLRNLRTDFEPDDIGMLMKVALELNEHYARTRELPMWNVIFSEGDIGLLQGKAWAMQVFLAQMCAQGLIAKEILPCFHYYYDQPTEIKGETRTGFEQIVEAARRLYNGEKCKEFFTEPKLCPVEQLYQAQDVQLTHICDQGSTPVIWEGSFAPVDGLIARYDGRQELCSRVKYFAYGSFNIHKTIDRNASGSGNELSEPKINQGMKTVSQLFASFASVCNVEMFLASRREVGKNKEGNPIYSDFNRVGLLSHPEIFAPMRAAAQNQAPSILKFYWEAMQGWNQNMVDKLSREFRNLCGDDSFMTELRERMQNGSMNEAEAVAFFHERYPARPPEEQVENRKFYEQIGKKMKILYSIFSNRQVQGTLSDLAVALLISDPSLIRPECIHMTNIDLSWKDSRVSVAFPPVPNGNAYAIETDLGRNTPAVDEKRLRQRLTEFMRQLEGRSPMDATSKV